MLLMHRVQARTRAPIVVRVYWRFGYFLLLPVGLYLPRSFFLAPRTIDPFAHSAHCFISQEYKIVFCIWQGVQIDKSNSQLP